MTKPMIRIYTTDDEYFDREMNAAEFKIHEADQAKAEAIKAEAEAKENAKAAILDRLGLTADELKTILG
jgi:uncharacterized protein YdaT